MAETGSVTGVGVGVSSCGRFQSSGSRNKEEISQIRDARTAEMGKAEAHDGRLVVFVSCRHIIVVIVGIGAYLYASERHLCPWIHVAETVCADERIDVINQTLLCRSVHGQAQKQDRKCISHSE